MFPLDQQTVCVSNRLDDLDDALLWFSRRISFSFVYFEFFYQHIVVGVKNITRKELCCPFSPYSAREGEGAVVQWYHAGLQVNRLRY